MKIWHSSFEEESTETDEIEDQLSLSCSFVVEYFADILRDLKVDTAVQKFLKPLKPRLIEEFREALETLIFEEIIEIEFDPEQPDLNSTDFDRWVGSLEYGPNTYLAEVSEAYGISPLYFPPRCGWYVNPGRVVNLDGEIFRVTRSLSEITVEQLS
ncbi:MAG: hypothetical protein WCA35_02230 [Kovacikia sp.]